MKYTFGDVCIDAAARTCSTCEGPRHLTRKAFDLLLLLLERRPDAVSKEHIYARLWPDTFVAESSLQTVIHEIRQAIDVRESEPSWIRTIHGIGYSFAGSVAASDAPAAPERGARTAAWLLGESTSVVLHAGENILGRGVDEVEEVLDIDSPAISRRHARITIGERVTLEDLGSKNGTWLAGERLTGPHALNDVGSLAFKFRLALQTKSTETADRDSEHRPLPVVRAAAALERRVRRRIQRRQALWKHHRYRHPGGRRARGHRKTMAGGNEHGPGNGPVAQGRTQHRRDPGHRELVA